MAASMPFPATVQVGDSIIFDVNGERQALVTIDAKSDVKLGKVFCSTAPIIGCPYGSMFALAADGKSLERIEYVPLTDWHLASPEAAPGFNTRTNAELVDSGSAQALSTADIEAMKAGGTAGADIVAALTANSTTFAGKTEFSQAKYKKKKARKYIQIASVRRPTAAAVCEAYFANSPAKIAYLRVDALALLLSLANVAAHARVLVVESCGGLVTAAVTERLGGHGGVVSTWVGGTGTKPPGLAMWRHLNLSPAEHATMRFAPLLELLAERRQVQQQQQQQQVEEQLQEEQGASELLAAGQVAMAVEGRPAELMEVQDTGNGPAEHQQQRRQQPAGSNGVQQAAGAGGVPQQKQRDSQQLVRAPFNSCILAATSVSPLALLRHVLPLLVPSASFAVFCPWQQPLAEAMDALRGQGQAAGLVLHESWWREMQVLPLRTHPTMNMNHGGGFILSGTVLTADQQQQLQQEQQ